jgi:hypothetical protein
MTILGASISGGFSDPELFGTEPPGTNLNAVYEYSDFVDKITVTLINEDPLLPPYTRLDNLRANVSVNGTPITLGEISANGNVVLNITYNSPNTNSVSGLFVTTTIESSNTIGNIYITGNIQNAFPDKYWEYKDFVSKESIVVDSTFDIPDSDVGIYTYKPSFMRYINIEFNVVAGFNSGTVSKTILKKVYNDWDINRIALISQVTREESYRSNNYPKGGI